MFLCSASKGALDFFARSMAYNLALRVRVNTFLPGGDCDAGDRKYGGRHGDAVGRSEYILLLKKGELS